MLLLAEIVYLPLEALTANLSELRYERRLGTQRSAEQVLEEVEHRLALGHFRGAEDHLRAAIIAEPNCMEFRVRLLDIYLRSGELSRFDRQLAPWANALKAHNDGGALRELLERRNRVQAQSGDGEETSSRLGVQLPGDPHRK